ncbi:MAG TPA: 50S ribosomal protein L25/general stress protein Ctc [Geminicoccaceae bacterium]|nr:50S ribosomal protein L25/general stress protein Ctc [Geminicoccaceae bacterium]
MSDVIEMPVEPRSGTGKGAARALRRQGRVPAIVYGDRKEPVPISVETRVLSKELGKPRFHSTLYNLMLDGETIRVLPREVQLHPVTDVPIHADFIRVAAGGTVTVEVPVVFDHEDECPGLRRGGVLNVVRREIELVCPADAIPEALHIDLKEADIGDSLHASQLRLPPNVRVTITDRDFTVATIVAPSKEEVEEPVEGETEVTRVGEEAEGETPAGGPAGTAAEDRG